MAGWGHTWAHWVQHCTSNMLQGVLGALLVHTGVPPLPIVEDVEDDACAPGCVCVVYILQRLLPQHTYTHTHTLNTHHATHKHTTHNIHRGDPAWVTAIANTQHTAQPTSIPPGMYMCTEKHHFCIISVLQHHVSKCLVQIWVSDHAQNCGCFPKHPLSPSPSHNTR